LKDLNEIQFENTKLVDFPILLSINIQDNGGVIDFDNYEDPIKKEHAKYESADLRTKLELTKEYSINEVLPVLSAYQVIVDDKFEGVKKFGKSIESTDFNKVQNINALTSTNKNYWRATMEMDIGNQLIPITKIFALASQGELDYAQKYIEIIQMFSDPETTSNWYLQEINYRISLFHQELHKQIEKGISEHDKGNFQNAIKIYDDILTIYPNSSWALYEKYFSNNAQKLSENKVTNDDRRDWDMAKSEIYKHNPLYNMDVRASNGREAYLLFRRQGVSNLFKKKDERLKDVFKYAEIATDLGIYDFAAQLFWLTATFDQGNSTESINNYLYCLDKLGERELKSNFKGNFDKIFETIEQNKEKEMKNSSIYKSMKN
jgi:tetratricopeptide (TPR) repeat protein